MCSFFLGVCFPALGRGEKRKRFIPGDNWKAQGWKRLSQGDNKAVPAVRIFREILHRQFKRPEKRGQQGKPCYCVDTVRRRKEQSALCTGGGI